MKNLYLVCAIYSLAVASAADVIPAPTAAPIIPSDEVLSNMITSTADAIKLVKSTISVEGVNPLAPSSSDAIIGDENNTETDVVNDYILADNLSKPPSLFIPPMLPAAIPLPVVHIPPLKKENKPFKKSNHAVKTKDLWEAKDILCHIEEGELICVHVKLDDISFDLTQCYEEVHGAKNFTVCKKKL